MTAQAVECLAELDDALAHALNSADLGQLTARLLARARHVYQTNPHGDRKKWQDANNNLAKITASSYDLRAPTIRIGAPQDCSAKTKTHLKQLLLQLKPWRKGPFELFGVAINSEWRSDLKWARLAEKITCLRDRRVLDVGCGNGYYLWRMLGQGARFVLGIDPTQLFIAQFDALKKYCDAPAFILPLKSEQFPISNCAGDNGDSAFDSVFSMGVLSHRRDPHAHLRALINFTRRGGELIVETLVVDGDADTVLMPAGRYAKMRNVHSIPSPLMLESWLKKSGATDIQLIDISTTTIAEQRATEWMQFESLADFLDPNDPSKTIEGYPSPQRAIFRCQRRD